jgi:hypothetical protein
MAKDDILLGEVAARGATMIEICCGRCDRHGRLFVPQLPSDLKEGEVSCSVFCWSAMTRRLSTTPILPCRQI